MQKIIDFKNKEDKIEFYLNNIAKFCDKCGAQYSHKDVKVIQDNNQSSIIHFNCSKCKSRHIATFVSSLGISSRTSVNTDLSVEEISAYSLNSKIEIDEILDINESLKKAKKVII